MNTPEHSPKAGETDTSGAEAARWQHCSRNLIRGAGIHEGCRRSAIPLVPQPLTPGTDDREKSIGWCCLMDSQAGDAAE